MIRKSRPWSTDLPKTMINLNFDPMGAPGKQKLKKYIFYFFSVYWFPAGIISLVFS